METSKEKKPKKFLALIVNDFQNHTTQPRNSFIDKILKLIKNEKIIRWHGKNLTPQEPDKEPNNLVTLDINQLKENLEKETGMEVRFFIKKSDVTPIYPGKDTMDALEKAKLQKKKRRPLTRFWRSDTLS